MSDLVKHLRFRASFVGSKIDTYDRPYDSRLDMEAADRIENLEAKIKEMLDEESELLTIAYLDGVKTGESKARLRIAGLSAENDLLRDRLERIAHECTIRKPQDAEQTVSDVKAIARFEDERT